MPAAKKRPGGPQSATPILVLGQDRLEYLAPAGNGFLYLERSLEDLAPEGESIDLEALPRLARRMLSEAGVRTGNCHLILAQGFGNQRLLELSAVGPKELRGVFSRKAANLLELPGGGEFYAAVPLTGTSAGKAEERWLLAAFDKRALVNLFLAMRRTGFRVKRATWERLGLLGAFDSSDQPSTQIIVAAETSSIVLSLVHDGDLVHQTVLQGDVTADPSLATVMLQELRSLEAYWRRVSRGQELAAITFVGIPEPMVDSLEPAIHAALPGVEIIQDVRVPEDDENLPPRVNVLLRCVSSARTLDLKVPLRPRRTVLAAGFVCALLLGGGAGLLEYQRLVKRNQYWLEQTESLRENAVAYHDVNRAYERMEVARETLQAERDRLGLAANLGIDVDALMNHTLKAFRGRAALLSLSAAPTGGSVSMTGVTSADPRRSLRALADLERALEDGPLLTGVELLPPSNIRSNENGEQVTRNIDIAVRATRQEGP